MSNEQLQNQSYIVTIFFILYCLFTFFNLYFDFFKFSFVFMLVILFIYVNTLIVHNMFFYLQQRRSSIS